MVRLGDEEVYRRDLEQDAMHTEVQLERGKRYPITITYMKSGSAAFWLKHIDIPGKGDLLHLLQQENTHGLGMTKGNGVSVMMSPTGRLAFPRKQMAVEAHLPQRPMEDSLDQKFLLAMSWVPIIRNQSF